MKNAIDIDIQIDPACTDPKVVIKTNRMTPDIDDIVHAFLFILDDSVGAIGSKTQVAVIFAKRRQKGARHRCRGLVFASRDEIDEHIVLLDDGGFGSAHDEFAAASKDFPQDEFEWITGLISAHFDEFALGVTLGMRITVARRSRLKSLDFKLSRRDTSILS